MKLSKIRVIDLRSAENDRATEPGGQPVPVSVTDWIPSIAAAHSGTTRGLRAITSAMTRRATMHDSFRRRVVHHSTVASPGTTLTRAAHFGDNAFGPLARGFGYHPEMPDDRPETDDHLRPPGRAR